MVWTEETVVVVDDVVCTKGYKGQDGKRVKAHWFQIPTPPRKAVGRCKNCGYERLHHSDPRQVGYGFNK